MDERRDRQAEETIPAGEKASEKAAERNRKEMDEIPPPGTDPLHEGP